MIVDAPALVALVRDEPDADRFFRALSDTREPKHMSAANYLEAAIVIDANRNLLLSRRFDDRSTGIAVEPVAREQAEIARAAYRNFGKGGGHPAGLNYGDCFAYAMRSPARAASRSRSRGTILADRRRLTSRAPALDRFSCVRS
jgi:ribonuclease VapC